MKRFFLVFLFGWLFRVENYTNATECGNGTYLGAYDIWPYTDTLGDGITAVVMAGESPADCCGVVTEWYFYAYWADDVHLQMWENVDLVNGEATLIAEITVSATNDSDNWFVITNEADQLPVRPGLAHGWVSANWDVIPYSSSCSYCTQNYLAAVSSGSPFGIGQRTQFYYKGPEDSDVYQYAMQVITGKSADPEFYNLPFTLILSRDVANTGDVIFNVSFGDPNTWEVYNYYVTVSIIDTDPPTDIFDVDEYYGMVSVANDVTTEPCFTVFNVTVQVSDQCNNVTEVLSVYLDCETTTMEPTTESPTTEPATTDPPTTEAPTSDAPTTEVPTTDAPTTAAPTTDAPTTEAPTTDAPTTEAPTTDPPTTEVPTTDAPTTIAPTTDAPTTEAPTTDAPTTEAPTTDAPTTEAPTTDAPTTEAPTTDAPTTEVPTTDAPTTIAPTTDAPTTEAPTTDAPTTEAPTTDAPTTEAPTTDTPTTEAPTTDAPTTPPAPTESLTTQAPWADTSPAESPAINTATGATEGDTVQNTEPSDSQTDSSSTSVSTQATTGKKSSSVDGLMIGGIVGGSVAAVGLTVGAALLIRKFVCTPKPASKRPERFTNDWGQEMKSNNAKNRVSPELNEDSRDVTTPRDINMYEDLEPSVPPAGTNFKYVQPANNANFWESAYMNTPRNFDWS